MNTRDLALALGAAALVLAASLSLDPVLVGGDWRSPTWLAILLALGLAAVAHGIRAGWVAAVVGSVVVWVLVTYGFHLEPDGLLPGREQLAEFVALWSAGIGDVMREPAPVTATPGLLLIIWTAVWGLTHAVHELVVRARRPGPAIALAGVLWALPLALRDSPGRTWPAAVPFLAAAVLALVLDPDVDLGRRHGEDRRWVRPSTAGLGIGAVAIIVASVFPAALPGYGEEAWVDLTADDGARGYQPIVDVTDRLQRPVPTDLLLVRTERPVYLRLAGLDHFDGGTWRLGPPDERSFTPADVLPADRPLPPEVEIREREHVSVEIENLALENVFVPTPYHPLRVLGGAARRMVYSPEGTFLATSDVTEGEPALIPGLSYTVEAALPAPSGEDLTAVGAAVYDEPAYAPWTALPQDYPELRQVNAAVADEFDVGSPFEMAFALQSFFRDPDRFVYSTDVDPLRSSEDVMRFVTEDRVGFCTYYATAMAVMLRLEGIPARVAVGFRLGERLEGDEYLVTSDHAHAWVEALFPGYGWITFEPTPALPDTLVPTPSDLAPDIPAGQQFTDLAEPADDAAVPDADPAGPDTLPDPGALDDPAAGPGDGGPAAAVLVALALLLLVVASGAVWWLTTARRRARPDLDTDERILAAQRWLYLDAASLGVGRRDAETAREVADRWVSEGRVEPSAAERLATLSQAAAFDGPVAGDDGAEAERLAGGLADDLRSSVPRREQLLAPVRAPVQRMGIHGRRTVDRLRERMEGDRRPFGFSRPSDDGAGRSDRRRRR